jgi:hypothetical protein
VLGQIAKAGERRGARRFAHNEPSSIQRFEQSDRRGLRASVLLQTAGNAGKRIVRVSADQTDCADDYDENYGKHHSVFGNILAFIVRPNAS